MNGERLRVLAIDDELGNESPTIVELARVGRLDLRVFQPEDARVPAVESVLDAISGFEPDLFLCDIDFAGELPDARGRVRTGLDLAGELHSARPALPIVMFTAFVGKAMQNVELEGHRPFVDVVTKIEAVSAPTRVSAQLRSAVERARGARQGPPELLVGRGDDVLRRGFPSRITTRSPDVGVRQFFEGVRKLAHSDEPVLLTGDPGVGKELFARALHYSGPRATESFTRVEAGLAQNQDELRSWLAGRLPGEFTAVEGRASGVWQAGRGTVVINDLFSAPLDAQSTLLALLERKPIDLVVREGGRLVRRTVAPVCRIVATANPVDLPAASAGIDAWRARGTRKDLFDRFVVLRVPGWDARQEDIPQAIQDNFDAEVRTRFSGARTPNLWQSEAMSAYLRVVIARYPSLRRGRAIQRIGHALANALRDPTVAPLLDDLVGACMAEVGEQPGVDPAAPSEARSATAPRAGRDPLDRFIATVSEAGIASETTRQVVVTLCARGHLDASDRALHRPDMFFPAHVWKLAEIDANGFPRSRAGRVARLEDAARQDPGPVIARWLELAIQRASTAT